MSMRPIIAFCKIEDIYQGQSFVCEHEITPSQVAAFALLSGDHSPLHMNDDFARKRGFSNRVVHGMFLGALLSRMVGVHFPGANAVLHGMNIKFLAPVYIDDTIQIIAHVDQISRGTETMVLKVVMENGSQTVVARATIQVGFTHEVPDGNG